MRGLRRLVAGLLVSIATTVAAGDEGAAFTISFAATKVVLVTDLTELSARCRTKVAIVGCTSLADELLVCRCRQADRGWGLTAALTASPVMYLTDVRTRAHEERHLADVDKTMSGYLRRLTSRRFATSGDCYRAAADEIIHFARRMDVIKLQSNWRLH